MSVTNDNIISECDSISSTDSLYNERSCLLRTNSINITSSSNVVVQDTDDIICIQPDVHHQTGTSWYVSVLLVVNAALGAGLLNFPSAYHQAGGVVTGVIIQAVFLIFIIAALVILAYCSDLQQTKTLQDVMLSICGKRWQLLCSAVLVLYCFGTCITFLIIIADQWEEFLLYVNRDLFCIQRPWYTSRAFTLCSTSIVFILPLCFSEDIDFLKYPSAIGVAGILYVSGLVTAMYFLPHTPPISITSSPKSWTDIFLVVPAICFAYQCHVSVIPIYSCIKPRTLRSFNKTIALAIGVCVLCYTVTAAFGYLMFGDAVTSDILLSFDPSPPVIAAVVLVAIKTYTTYPILIFCGRAALDSIWVHIRGLSKEQIVSQSRKRRYVMTIVWFVPSLVLGVYIPNIGVVIAVLGIFAATFIFVFPGWCLIRLVFNESPPHLSIKERFMLVAGSMFIVLGVFIIGVTITQAISQDVTGSMHQDISRYTC